MSIATRKSWRKDYLEALLGTSLAVQWLGLCAPNAGGTGSIPGRGTKIPHAAQCSLKKKKALLLEHRAPH